MSSKKLFTKHVDPQIAEDFLHLTQYVTPHGTEMFWVPWLIERLPNHSIDEKGNVFCVINGKESPKVCFLAHIDTVGSGFKETKRFVSKDDKMFTDGKTILGADDKAGVCVLLDMIRRKIPGCYIFPVGEERGLIGSKAIARRFSAWNSDKTSAWPYPIVVCFDRFGTKELITHQRGVRMASDKAAKYLCKRLKLKPSDKGSYTDSAAFDKIASECFNVSVGYLNQHSPSETQDLRYLTALCKRVAAIDWSKVPIERPVTEAKTYSYSGYKYSGGSSWNPQAPKTVPTFQQTNDWMKSASNKLCKSLFNGVTIFNATPTQVFGLPSQAKINLALTMYKEEQWYGLTELYKKAGWHHPKVAMPPQIKSLCLILEKANRNVLTAGEAVGIYRGLPLTMQELLSDDLRDYLETASEKAPKDSCSDTTTLAAAMEAANLAS